MHGRKTIIKLPLRQFLQEKGLEVVDRHILPGLGIIMLGLYGMTMVMLDGEWYLNVDLVLIGEGGLFLILIPHFIIIFSLIT